MPARIILFFVPLLTLPSAEGPEGLTGTTGISAGAEVRRIGIKEAVESALRNDRELQSMKSELFIVEKSVSPHFLYRIPRFSLGYGGEESFDLYSEYNLEHSISAGIEWQILSGGAPRREREALRLRRDLLLSHIEERSAALTRQTVVLAVEIFRRRQDLLITDRMKEVLHLELRTAETLEEDQRLTDLEKKEFALEERRLEISRREKELALTDVEVRFSTLTTPSVEFMPATPISPSGRLIRNPVPLSGSSLPSEESFYREQAALHNLEVRAVEREREGLHLEELSQPRVYLPTITLYGRLHLSGQALPLHIPAFTVGMNISSSSSLWNIKFEDTLYRSKIEETREVSALLSLDPGVLFEGKNKFGTLKKQAVDARTSEAGRKAAHTAANLYRNLLLLEERHRLALERVKLGKARLKLAEIHYSLGRISLKNLLKAKEEAAHLEMEVTDLSADRCIREIELLEHCGLMETTIPVSERYIEKEGS